MKSVNVKDFVDRLDKLLEKKGMTRKCLLTISIPSSTISSWIGKNRLPRAESLIDIANFLDTNIDYLLYGDLNDENFKEIEKLKLPENKKNLIKKIIKTNDDFKIDLCNDFLSSTEYKNSEFSIKYALLSDESKKMIDASIDVAVNSVLEKNQKHA